MRLCKWNQKLMHIYQMDDFYRKFKIEHRVASKFPSETSEYVQHARMLGKVLLGKLSSTSRASLQKSLVPQPVKKLWKTKVYYCIYKRSSLHLIVNQISRFQNLQSCSSRINLNIILPFTSGFSVWTLSLIFST